MAEIKAEGSWDGINDPEAIRDFLDSLEEFLVDYWGSKDIDFTLSIDGVKYKILRGKPLDVIRLEESKT